MFRRFDWTDETEAIPAFLVIIGIPLFFFDHRRNRSGAHYLARCQSSPRPICGISLAGLVDHRHSAGVLHHNSCPHLSRSSRGSWHSPRPKRALLSRASFAGVNSRRFTGAKGDSRHAQILIIRLQDVVSVAVTAILRISTICGGTK